MAVVTASDLQLAVNQILYAMFKGYGLDFPFYQVTRTGGMSEADAITLRNTFMAYYQTRENAQVIAPNHEDVPDPNLLDQEGKSGIGGSGSEDTNVGDHTFQYGRQ